MVFEVADTVYAGTADETKFKATFLPDFVGWEVILIVAFIGAAMPEPDALAQPLTVCVTVYVPALLTLMDEVVSVVLHNKVPDAEVDKIDVPLQLFTTFTVGADGVVFGVANPEPTELVQPSIVCITVYVPALLTVIDEVVSVVLHNNVPDAVVDKVDVPLQLFTTFTEGVDGVVFGDATPEPAELVQPSTVCVTV